MSLSVTSGVVKGHCVDAFGEVYRFYQRFIENGGVEKIREFKSDTMWGAADRDLISRYYPPPYVVHPLGEQIDVYFSPQYGFGTVLDDQGNEVPAKISIRIPENVSTIVQASSSPSSESSTDDQSNTSNPDPSSRPRGDFQITPDATKIPAPIFSPLVPDSIDTSQKVSAPRFTPFAESLDITEKVSARGLSSPVTEFIEGAEPLQSEPLAFSPELETSEYYSNDGGAYPYSMSLPPIGSDTSASPALARRYNTRSPAPHVSESHPHPSKPAHTQDLRDHTTYPIDLPTRGESISSAQPSAVGRRNTTEFLHGEEWRKAEMKRLAHEMLATIGFDDDVHSQIDEAAAVFMVTEIPKLITDTFFPSDTNPNNDSASAAPTRPKAKKKKKTNTRYRIPDNAITGCFKNNIIPRDDPKFVFLLREDKTVCTYDLSTGENKRVADPSKRILRTLSRDEQKAFAAARQQSTEQIKAAFNRLPEQRYIHAMVTVGAHFSVACFDNMDFRVNPPKWTDVGFLFNDGCTDYHPTLADSNFWNNIFTKATVRMPGMPPLSLYPLSS